MEENKTTTIETETIEAEVKAKVTFSERMAALKANATRVAKKAGKVVVTAVPYVIAIGAGAVGGFLLHDGIESKAKGEGYEEAWKDITVTTITPDEENGLVQDLKVVNF